MKPWREIAVPHRDVLSGKFKQSEFAADLAAVQDGKASPEYQDAVAFYQRTFITEGMRMLLVQVAERLNGNGGEPVIQLQTAFGGGKTHSMLAAYHLASRQCPLANLAGISAILDQAKLKDMPKATVAVLDGNALAPGQPWKHGRQAIRTLWGELAWQLGKGEGLALVRESDDAGTSPGKEVLRQLLETYSPCVVLIDELVAYVRQFPEDGTLSGGSFDSNLSFVQALTEAAKLVPNAIVLASLPDSHSQAGGPRGVAALQALEAIFNRIQALWKTVGKEESFEIVRRRLFEPIREEKSRDQVCRAFADAYLAEGDKFPNETQESRYFNRLVQAYPIHPEVFDRLYEDWSTIPGFQRTRGILKLMAQTICRLWQDDNKDMMIMPGSLPLYDSATRAELTYYLAQGWDPVIDKDIDSEQAETSLLEKMEPRFGTFNAARRVARTVFLGSAPSSLPTHPGIRGLDRAHILLGCFQPGQTSSIYADALGRLADRLHYLNASGDKSLNSTRFWFDTRANLRREMEERKKRFDETTDIRAKIATVLQRMAANVGSFEGVHAMTPHADVNDDGLLRLVILPPDRFYSREEPRLAFEAVKEFLLMHGSKPRLYRNRLLFLAPDHATLARLRECVRASLAWNSIVEDVAAMRLVLDTLQVQQAKNEAHGAEHVLPGVVRECYKWLLCPILHKATDTEPVIEPFKLNTGGNSLGAELDHVCGENGLVVAAWSPIHLRNILRELYWKPGSIAVGAMAFWEDTLRYLYMPRLKNLSVMEQAVAKGAPSQDFFGTAYGQAGEIFEGFKLGDSNIQLDETLLLIEPDTAKAYATTHAAPPASTIPIAGGGLPPTTQGQQGAASTTGGGTRPPAPRHFFGKAEIKPHAAKMRLAQIADEIINVLAQDPKATLSVSLEIHADFPDGVSDQIKRAVSENANTLSLQNKEWE